MPRFAALLLLLTLPMLAAAQQQDPDQVPIDEYLQSADPDAPLIIRDPFGTGADSLGLDSQIDPQTGQPVDPLSGPLTDTVAPGTDEATEDTLRPIDDGVITSEDIARTEAAPQEYAVPMVDAPAARLRGLDTLTNTVNDFEIAVGETLAFKRLIVTLEACRYPQDEIGTEAFAYLHIRDRRDEAQGFDGWMLASSPALSALDHPRYDIWVLSCSID